MRHVGLEKDLPLSADRLSLSSEMVRSFMKNHIVLLAQAFGISSKECIEVDPVPALDTPRAELKTWVDCDLFAGENFMLI